LGFFHRSLAFLRRDSIEQQGNGEALRHGMLIMRKGGRPRTGAIVAGTLAALLLTTASARAADTIAVSFGADPTEEVPLPVTLTWSSQDSTAGAFLTIKPSGSLGCAPNYSADHANSRDVTYAGRQASGSKSTNWTETDPGSFLLCAYLHHDSNGESAPLATATATLTLRSARATVGVVPPARVDAGQKFTLNIPVTTELQRGVFATQKPAGGRGCESTYQLDRANAVDVLYRNVQGTATASTEVTASRTNGTYLLCVYIQESSGDPAPEATASATYLVGPDPCVTARQNLATANTAVKTVERSVTRYRTSYRRYAQRARHAHGAKRRSLLRLSARDKSRYRSAVRRRAAARGTLGKAQAAVTAACGGATAAVAGVAAETTPTNARDAIAASLGAVDARGTNAP
jgi:hypothetical protein